MTNFITLIISLLITLSLSGTQPSLQADKAADTARVYDVQRLSKTVLMYQSDMPGKLPAADELSTTGLEQITMIVDKGQPTTSRALYTIGKNCDGDISSGAYSITIALASGGTYCNGS